MSLIFDRAAFARGCLRADIVVTPLCAPPGCAAALVLDRDKLKETSAVTFAARGIDEGRPWSPALEPSWGRAAHTETATVMSDDPSGPLE